MKDMFRNIFENGLASDIYKTLHMALFGDSSSFEQASNFAEKVYDSVMVPIAFSLLIIYFCVVFVEKTTHEQFSYEQMFALFAKVIVGIFLIDKGWDLMMYFHDFGLLFLEDFHENVTGAKFANFSIDESKELQAAFKELTGSSWDEEWGLFDNLEGFFNGGISIWLAGICSLGARAVVHIVIYLRILEIYLRTMFAPIALPDVFYNGLNSNGFRFFKNYLATSIQVVIIYGVALLQGQLAAGLIKLAGDGKDNTAFVIMYVGLTLASVGIMLKSQSLAKEFIGA